MCTCVFLKRGETEYLSETPQLVTLNLLDHTRAFGYTHSFDKINGLGVSAYLVLH